MSELPIGVDLGTSGTLAYSSGPTAYEVYKNLYPATRPMSHVLADLQTRGEP